MAQSRLHKVMEDLNNAFDALGGKPGYDHWKKPDVDFFRQSGAIEEFFQVPHYVIDDHVREIVLRSDREASRAALKEVGAYRLPHPQTLVESQMAPNPIVAGNTMCALIREAASENTFEVILLLRGDNGSVAPPFVGLFNVDTMEYDVSTLFAPDDEAQQRFASLAIDFIDLAILLRHIRGMSSEKVEAPARLNKARVAKKKYPIAGFTHLYIGAIEDASGKSHTYTGRTMPVHMRAGHTRKQRYGKGLELVKTVYIQPVLVNFTPGDEVPVPRRIVKLAGA